jgi:hypothetical protein
MARPLSVAIVGARTVRQGTGPWFAKHFAAAGADVCGILGTSINSAAAAQDELQQRFGLTVPAHASWDEMLAACHPDMVAIATPADTHRDYLWKAHAAGIPVFVEKPFIWDEQRDNVSDTQELVAAFESARLPLYINTQWLETLDTFQQLYPECDLQGISSFEMLLSPTSSGPNMVIDALPHAWSMLLKLAGPGELRTLARTHTADSELTLAGEFEGHNGITRFSFEMKRCPEQPRPFGFSINGCRVDRVLDLEDYSMSFSAAGRCAPLRDPLAARIEKVLTLISQNAYNNALRQQVLETRLLKQSIEVSTA